MRIEIETERIGEERGRWRERKIARKSDNGWRERQRRETELMTEELRNKEKEKSGEIQKSSPLNFPRHFFWE